MAQPMSATNPFLNFPWGPIQMECEAHDLVVEGEVPADLCGSLYCISCCKFAVKRFRQSIN